MPATLAARLRPPLARLAHAPRTDADLLGRFVADRDEAAFAELVRRHGPAVLAVCRRITRSSHDADDAFQAAFLVLARKADRVRPGEPLAAWLYGVAVRAARATLSRAHRHRSRERSAAELPDVPARPADGIADDDARAVLAEVGRLSAGLRAAVVLCELEGRSRSAAARELGIPEGTLSSRLAAARKVLAGRLRDRGLAAAVLAAVAVSARGAHPVWSSDVSSRVSELAEGVMRTGYTLKMVGAAVVLAAGLVAYARPEAETAPAPRPADPSRLVLGFAGHVRFLTPDGREVGRVTGEQVKAAGADIHTKAMGVGIGTKGVEFPVWDIWAPCGRPAPDGRLPIATKKGLYLLAADRGSVAPVLCKDGKPAFAAGPMPQVAAWSPDGTQAVAVVHDDGFFGPGTSTSHRIDLAAGTVERLKLPAGHWVKDWSADGNWFLTTRTEHAFSLFGGGWSSKVSLCRVSADGQTVEALAAPQEFVWQAALSPDGTKVAYTRMTAMKVRTRAVAGDTEVETAVWNGFELVVLDLATMTRTTVLRGGGGPAIDQGETAAGVRWSPDGRRLAVSAVEFLPGKELRARVRVCDAGGGNARVVWQTDPVKADGAAPWPTVFDWR